jgi:hypothetical protein
VVNVANRADVNMRFRSLKLLFSHVISFVAVLVLCF